MKAPPHPDEIRRLQILRELGILDTPREKDFDEIVELAAQICEAPISVVNLIDECRQWFKAETGLGVRETPLDTSICAHIILQEDFVVVPDTLADARFADNPLCLAEPRLRFYAGAVLKSDHGLPIGTLCVIDTKPRTLSPLQSQALRVLAKQVMLLINMRRALDVAEMMKSRLELSIGISKIGLFDWLPQKNQGHWDARVRELFGVSAEEPVTHELLMACIHPADREMVRARITASLDAGGAGQSDYVYRVIGRDHGKLRWVQAFGQTYFENDEPVRRLGTIIDVTSQKLHEQRQLLTLEISRRILEAKDIDDQVFEDIYKLMASHLGAEFCLRYHYDVDTHQLMLLNAPGFPDEMLRLVEKIQPEDSVCWDIVSTGKPVAIAAPEIASNIKAKPLLELEVGAYVCNPLLDSQGKLIGTLAFASRERRAFEQGDVEWLQTISHYLSTALERGAALKAVDASEKLLRRAQKAAGIGTWDWDVSANKVVWTAEAWKLLDPGGGGEATFERWQACLHPEDRAATVAKVAAAVKEGGAFRFEYRVQHSDGAVRWLESRGDMEQDRRGNWHMRGSLQDITEKKRIEQELKNNERFLTAVTETVPIAIYVFNTVNGASEFVSRHSGRYLGYDDEEFAAIIANPLQLMHPDDAAHFPAHLAKLAGARNGNAVDFEYRLRHADGSWRWMLSRDVVFARDGQGRMTQLLGSAIDITAQKQAVEHNQLLMAEVNHRAKNLLAVVQSIARQTAKSSSPEEFADHLSMRLQGLTASQDLIISGNWQGVALENLVRSQLMPLGEGFNSRIEITGPHLVLTPASAQGIGMALHELATNAMKYGSLSNDQGKIHVHWQAVNSKEGPALRLRWKEQHGPAVKKPKHAGFGQTVIERMAAMATGGEVVLDYDPHGLIWELEAPQRNILQGVP